MYIRIVRPVVSDPSCSSRRRRRLLSVRPFRPSVPSSSSVLCLCVPSCPIVFVLCPSVRPVVVRPLSVRPHPSVVVVHPLSARPVVRPVVRSVVRPPCAKRYPTPNYVVSW